MDFKIDVDPTVFDKAKEKLSPSQIANAMRMAINEGLTKGRTEVRKGLQEVYNIRTSVLNDAKTGLQINKATNKNLSGDIHASNKPLPISEMDPKFKGKTIGQSFSRGKNGKVKKGRIVKRSVGQISIEVIKGQRKILETAFIPGRAANASTGMQGFTRAVFARGLRGKPGFAFSKPRLPIDSLSTVSPGTAASNERSVEKYSGTVKSYAEQRFVHHIERMIKAVDGLE
jgi:hypothetical protein